MWRMSAIQMTAFPTPSVNLVGEQLRLTAVCRTEMRGPPLTANWKIGDRCTAYITRNGLLSGKIYLADKVRTFVIFKFFMMMTIRTLYVWVTTPCSVVGGCRITAVCLNLFCLSSHVVRAPSAKFGLHANNMKSNMQNEWIRVRIVKRIILPVCILYTSCTIKK
jgi:hypothetical protein